METIEKSINYNEAQDVAIPLYTNGAKPLDCRYVVESVNEIINPDDPEDPEWYVPLFTTDQGSELCYRGMQVFARDTQLIYILKYDETINDSYFVEYKTGSDIKEADIVTIINKQNLVNNTTLSDTLNTYYNDTIKPNLTNLYKIKGVIDDVTNLPKDPSVGDVYNVRNRFTIEVTLSDGSTQLRTYPAGTNVVWIEYDVLVERQKTNPETGAPLFKEDGTTPDMEQVKETRTHWDALGGVSEFDWIDIVEEPEEPESGTEEPTEPTA